MSNWFTLPTPKSAAVHPREQSSWHYGHNKLLSHLPPGKTFSHLDMGGLLDTNRSPRGKEEAKSSWKLASSRQMIPVWHWFPDWVIEKFTDGSLVQDSGCKVNKVMWTMQAWTQWRKVEAWQEKNNIEKVCVIAFDDSRFGVVLMQGSFVLYFIP